MKRGDPRPPALGGAPGEGRLPCPRGAPGRGALPASDSSCTPSSSKMFCCILPGDCHFYNLDTVCFLNYRTLVKIAFLLVSFFESGFERGQKEGRCDEVFLLPVSHREHRKVLLLFFFKSVILAVKRRPAWAPQTVAGTAR